MSEYKVNKLDDSHDGNLVSGRRQVKIQQVSIGAIFSLCCFIGGLLIYLGVEFNSYILALLCPLILMIGYWLVVRNTNTGMPLSVIGDSYYYMGFIFTMFSLVISLLSLSNSDGVNINSIVGSFGSALLTTILGLILRLVTTSFSVQTKEKRENLESEIEHSLLRFSAQLETLTSEVSVSLTKVQNETQKVLLDSANTYRNVQESLTISLKKAMLKDQEIISNSMQELSDKISLIEVKPDIISQPIKIVLKDIIGSLNSQNDAYKAITKDLIKVHSETQDNLLDSVGVYKSVQETVATSFKNSMMNDQKEISASMRDLSNKISLIDLKSDVISKPIESALSDLINTINTQNVTYKEITDDFVIINNNLSMQLSQSGSYIQTHMDKLDNRLENSIKVQLNSYNESIRQITKSIIDSFDFLKEIKHKSEKEIKTQIININSELGKISSCILQIEEPITNSIKSIDNGIKNFSYNIDNLNEKFEKMNTSINIVGSQNKSLEDMSVTLNTFVNSLSQFNEQLNDSVKLSKDSNNSLVRSVGNVNKSSEQMLTDINNVYGELANQIKSLRD